MKGDRELCTEAVAHDGKAHSNWLSEEMQGPRAVHGCGLPLNNLITGEMKVDRELCMDTVCRLTI